MFELLSLLAALVSAGAAVFIAHRANAIAQNANAIATQGNDITERATRLEADKHLVEWAQRVLACASALVALRTLKSSDIGRDEFIQKRRDHRSSLFALKEEGTLFFRFNGNPGDASAPAALRALQELTDLTHGIRFKPPADDYDKNAVSELRRPIRDFIADIQARVGDHWAQ